MKIAALLLLAGNLAAQTDWEWKATAPLSEGRSEACVVRLADGRVLVAGGRGESLSSVAEIYRVLPREAFAKVAPMILPRAGHACTLLDDGRVLVVGGAADDSSSAEVYDPNQDLWFEVKGLPIGAGATATRLRDGRVLVVGGNSKQLQLFVPDSNEFVTLEVEMSVVREGHSATMLLDGNVLLAGGKTGSLELLDGETLTIRGAGELVVPRFGHTATLMADGRVLIAGGRNADGELDSLEVYRLGATGTELSTAKLATKRSGHIAVAVEGNGTVLIAGGASGGEALASTELFDPATDIVTAGGALTAARTGMAGVLLEDGRAMAIGGRNANGPNPNCGVIASAIVRFSQSVYRLGERAAISGSVNVTGTVSAGLSLKRINLSTGATTDISNRLLSTTVVVSNGRIAPTPIVDVNSTDPGGDLELVVNVPVAGRLVVRVQARFAFQFSMNAPAVIVAGQALPIIAVPQGGLTNISGSYTFRDGVRSVTVNALSGVTTTNLCCPSTPVSLLLSGRYSGSNLYEAFTPANVPVQVASQIPRITITQVAYRVLTPSLVPVFVGSDPLGAVPAPSGSVSQIAADGTTVGTLPLVSFLAATGGARKADFTITPKLAERRAGVCFLMRYSGDSIYSATSSSTVPICSVVGPAATTLSISTGPYTFGQPMSINTTLNWPDALGIVGRTVTVSTNSAFGSNLFGGTVSLTPDPTGVGRATGNLSLTLPFQTTQLQMSYAPSGDLDGTRTSLGLTMSPVVTSMAVRVPANVTNPFTVSYTMTIQNNGQTIPSGTALGGTVDLLDGTQVVATQAVPALSSVNGGGITDGTSNTIFIGEAGFIIVRGSVINLIRPVGSRTLTVRFNGGPLFAPSQGQATTVVQ